MNIVTNPKLTALFELETPFRFTTTNKLGQYIEFFEHPQLGDSTCVYGRINGVYFNTTFFDLDDMLAEDGEYKPHLVDGGVFCGYELDRL